MGLIATSRNPFPRAPLGDALFETALRLGDNALILAQRLCEWSSRAPNIEIDIALQNQSLDLIGQAQMFLGYAGRIEGRGRDEDKLAYFREDFEFRNVQLVELPNGDFAQTEIRLFLFATYAELLFGRMVASSDAELAAIAAKAVKEMAYHARHAGEWVVRLGDGTAESHARAEAGLRAVWPFTHELFMADDIDRAMVDAGVMPDLDDLRTEWHRAVAEVLEEAGLQIPDDDWKPEGGRRGLHTQELSYILAEMQSVARSDPEASW